MKPLAIILGASSGMGMATALKLAREGFNLCVLYRERRQQAREAEEAFDRLRSQGCKILSYNKDALDAQSREEVMQQLLEQGVKVSLLLHSIARGNLKLMVPYRSGDHHSKTSAELERLFADETHFLQGEDFQLTTEAMALSFYHWVKALHAKNLFEKEAMTLALTSEGSKKAWRNYAAVSVAKAALEAVARSIALEFAPYGIRCNILQPGVTDTRALHYIKGYPLIREQSLDRNPFGRLTTPEDVADVVYLMSRKEAQWINGAIIPVDGGESIA
ncbi:MAG TPA: short-chain dehydrogenase [Cryomorphaceae bacterium]|nr:short-chain dehydrogenase [Owenweeksia sp.]MBG00616.1 short-chain dehydrogenase [Owenweeksia sp.]HAD95805.1 short-chain dehydrogenase [Cryomorphaceae bacterium]